MAVSEGKLPYENPFAAVLVVCLSLVLQYSRNVAAEEGRIIMIKEPTANTVIKGHIISRAEVPNEGSCRVKCYMEPSCVSINMGPLNGRKIECELNNATGENEFASALKYQAAHTYLAIENPCSSSPCSNNGTCQAGFTSKGFRCNCHKGFIGSFCDRLAKSCSDLKKLDYLAESGSYVIDPDGKGGLSPMYDVTCDMNDKDGVGVTVISHDSENRTLVTGYEAAGKYKREIHYKGANLTQLATLTNVSSHCEQFIKYECKGSVLHKNGTQFGWWVSRNSSKMLYWGGATPGSGKCACGMNNTCAGYKNFSCNCDKNDDELREDSGLLTDKTSLPVIQLRFGDTSSNGSKREEGYHTLGKLKCYGTAHIDHDLTPIDPLEQ